MKKTEILVTCDLNNKEYLNLKDAILYVGYGSKDTFQNWREGIKIGKKTHFLKYRKLGKNIIYRRTDLRDFIEETNHAKQH
jgi:hypothetical protein